MIQEAIQEVQRLAIAGSSVQVQDIPALRKVAVVIRGVKPEDDNIAIHDYKPKQRSGTLFGINDVAIAALDGKISKSPEIYHDAKQVVILIDRDDRHEVISMPLVESSRWQTIKGLQLGHGFQPNELIKWIRFKLPGVVGANPLLAALRKVDFKRSSDGQRTTEHGKESLGMSIEAEVQGAQEIPTEFSAKVPVYCNPGLLDATEVTVRIGVHIDVENKRIEITPLADELNMAHDRAQLKVGDVLRAEAKGVPVFFGSPC